MNESKIKPGDVVRMKAASDASGEPKMTVLSFRTHSNSDRVTLLCAWFNKATYQYEEKDFPEVALRKLA